MADSPTPVTATNSAELLSRLPAHRMLGGSTRSELEWLVGRGVRYQMEPGDLLTASPELMESLVVVLSGHFAIYVDHGAGPHKVMEWRGGDISGRLPYSRMTRPLGEVVVDEAGDAFLVHSRHFPDMVRDCPAMTSELVHLMVDRARVFR